MNVSPQLLLLPLAGEGGLRVSGGRMRGLSARATFGVGSRFPGIPHPTRLRRAIFSREREKEEPRAVLMVVRRPPNQLGRARSMRSAPTKAEDILWRSLRSGALGQKFRRQVPIGPYVADFACLPANLVVELDGPPHQTAEQQARDRARDLWFAEHGWHVLRFPNEIVFGNGNLVLDRIKLALHRGPSSDPTSSGHLLPQAGEGGCEENR